MTGFQFTLIMKALLLLIKFQLVPYKTETWEKGEKDYEELQSMFSLWKITKNEIEEANNRI